MLTGQGDCDTTGCLLDYPYLAEHYKLIAIDLPKQQVLDGDPKAVQQINVTGKIERDGNTETFLTIEEAKEIILDFSQRTMKVL